MKPAIAAFRIRRHHAPLAGGHWSWALYAESDLGSNCLANQFGYRSAAKAAAGAKQFQTAAGSAPIQQPVFRRSRGTTSGPARARRLR